MGLDKFCFFPTYFAFLLRSILAPILLSTLLFTIPILLFIFVGDGIYFSSLYKLQLLNDNFIRLVTTKLTRITAHYSTLLEPMNVVMCILYFLLTIYTYFTFLAKMLPISILLAEFLIFLLLIVLKILLAKFIKAWTQTYDTLFSRQLTELLTAQLTGTQITQNKLKQ